MSLQRVSQQSRTDIFSETATPLPSSSFSFLKRSDVDGALIAEITSFLDSQRTSHPFQWPQWSDIDRYYALIRNDEKLVWFANCGIQYPMRARVPLVRSVMVNRGPVCDDAAVWNTGLNRLQSALKLEGFVHLDVAPDWVISDSGTTEMPNLFGWEPRQSGRASLRLDLTADCDRMFSRFRKNTRYEIRRAERSGVCVDQAGSETEVNEFLALYQQMAGRKGFAPDPANHICHVVRWLMKEETRGKLLLARYARKLIAGAVVVRSARRCWYIWGASERCSEVNAGHLLQWNALFWAKSQGCTEYDFGGYTPGATSGPAWFKQGFGAEVVYFVPVYRSVQRPLQHRLLETFSRV